MIDQPNYMFLKVQIRHVDPGRAFVYRQNQGPAFCSTGLQIVSCFYDQLVIRDVFDWFDQEDELRQGVRM